MKLSSKIVLSIMGDFCFLSLAFVLASLLTRQPLAPHGITIATLFAFVSLQLVAFFYFGVYHAILRYASIGFLLSVLKAVTVATVILISGFYVVHVPIASEVVSLYWLLTVTFVGGSRLLVRLYFEYRQRNRQGRRVIIYGAGDMGALALRQLKLNRDMLYFPVGFVDDDPSKKGHRVQGVQVLGTIEDMESIVDSKHIEEVIVAIAEIDGEKLRDVVKRCRSKNVACKIIPCFSRLLEIEPEMRNIELADLIRRAPQDLNDGDIKKYLYDKCVLVTGAAGSIGSELVKQGLKYGPKKIIAMDRSEYGLYNLREELGDKGIYYALGDITNIDLVEQVFRENRPNIVFHAAAYKHVPMLEDNIVEAIRNNVGGTKIVSMAADKYDVASFVLISTDKAVKPSSVMGITKRVAELFVQNYNRLSKTEFVAVRFGNVLGSSGSVIPKFLEQIKQGGPVTVTHPDATRYFMLIDEAVKLVLQAASIGQGGEIFILNMGKPIKIVEMAEDLIYLMGRVPYKGINIEYIGLRAGEKICEELFNDEIEKKTCFEDITIGKTILLNWDWLAGRIDKLLETNNGLDHRNLLNAFRELMPGAALDLPNKNRVAIAPQTHDHLADPTLRILRN